MNEPATVLVIDDDPSICESLRRLFDGRYQVRIADHGEAGLVAAQSPPYPDVILLDVRMPDMSGYEVFKALNGRPRVSKIPVIFITGAGAVKDEEKALEMGAADYIAKPLRPSLVRARVDAQVELKQARERLEDENVRLESVIRARMRENETMQSATIAALASLAEVRDGDTGHHIARTQAYVRLLADYLKHLPRDRDELTECNIELMVKSAPLHDIGKVGIPDQVLLKPGALDAAQWLTMRHHAAMGAEALERAERQVNARLPFLHYAKQIARWHHERWDGTGYPDGLAGDVIPLCARLMAVADVFDALISVRVYKPAMSFKAAREIMIEGRGTHFDPVVLDAFLDQFDAVCAIARAQTDRDLGQTVSATHAAPMAAVNQNRTR
ncbi:response regulator [Litorivicinus lipolyticus]|uniref:Response regulator n=1 Tax=Litorivicinus lipolyticus TaxID=418701 RepID=A0A5Q2QFG0_9GAMM|nr:HD domain-containing phosphohydrolase [Litorivicinus lipolyticus]QGG81072.1 response regulator [Litorivicinus lipolyticus]